MALQIVTPTSKSASSGHKPHPLKHAKHLQIALASQKISNPGTNTAIMVPTKQSTSGEIKKPASTRHQTPLIHSRNRKPHQPRRRIMGILAIRHPHLRPWTGPTMARRNRPPTPQIIQAEIQNRLNNLFPYWILEQAAQDDEYIFFTYQCNEISRHLAASLCALHNTPNYMPKYPEWTMDWGIFFHRQRFIVHRHEICLRRHIYPAWNWSP